MVINVSEEHTASVFNVEVPTLKMKAAQISNTLGTIYQTIRGHNTKTNNLHLHCRESKSE
jgi:hypothetical protein